MVGSDENTSAINDAVGVLVSQILVPLWPPSAEFVALMDAVWVFRKEDTVVRSIFRGGRVQSEVVSSST